MRSQSGGKDAMRGTVHAPKSASQSMLIFQIVVAAHRSYLRKPNQLVAGLRGRLRLDRADDQLGVGRARDDVEVHAVALAVAVGPRGADFEPGALHPAFLLD